jgi:branched-chain amino acid transport system permease protein
VSEVQSEESRPASGHVAAISPAGTTAAADAPTVQVGGGRSWLPRSTLLRHLILLILGGVVAVLLLEGTDEFGNSQLTSLAYYAMAAGGLTVLTGLNGQISLGHGALMAVGAYTTALFLQSQNPIPLPVIFLVAVAVTVVIGGIVGVAAARLHGPYLAGATLALAVGLPELGLYFKDQLGGSQGLGVPLPEGPDWFGHVIGYLSGNFVTPTKWLAYIAAACLLIVFFLLANLGRSRVGRTWRAVRDQEVAAELAGINLGAWRVTAFVVSAACAGLAGGVMVLAVHAASPGAFPLVLSLSLLTAIVIGGLGSLVGALLGSALLVYLPPAVTDFATSHGLDGSQAAQVSPLVYGVVLVLVMLLAPAGVMGSLRLLWLRLSSRRAAVRANGR